MSMTVCRTKKHFDTEFEAILFANQQEYQFGVKFVPYQCPGWKHWHLTHADRQQRQGAGRGWAICPNCSIIVKRKDVRKHKCEGVDDE